MRRKWSPSSRGFAALGVILAVGAFLIVRGYAQRVHAMGAAVGSPVPVVVVDRSLPRGSVLDDDALQVREIPSAYAPPGAIHRLEDARGRILLAPLAVGEVVTETRVAPEGGGPLASLVPYGYRAVAIATALTPSGIRPGDQVDVLATFGGNRAHTETVVTGVQVLQARTNDDAAAEGSGESVLVLLVSPTQAEQLAFARAFADLSVSVVASEEVVAPEGP